MFYFSPLDNLTISRFVRFTIFLVTVSSLQCAVYAGAGLAGAGVETPTAFPPSAEEIESIEGTSKMVLTSTPLDQKRKFDGQSTVSVVKCHYDDAGFLSNIRLDRASDSIDQDFQTLWAVSSFPPLKPFGPFRALEPTMIICNAPGIVSGATEEQLIIRSSLSEHLQKASEGDAGRIYFTLIPGSFILVFPKDIKILDVCGKENIVSIPIDSFEKIRKVSLMKWTQNLGRNIRIQSQHCWMSGRISLKQNRILTATRSSILQII
jgi:hypothetical protein